MLGKMELSKTFLIQPQLFAGCSEPRLKCQWEKFPRSRRGHSHTWLRGDLHRGAALGSLKSSGHGVRAPQGRAAPSAAASPALPPASPSGPEVFRGEIIGSPQ